MSQMAFDLRGCGSLLVTPFDERGRIDFGALESLVDWQIAEGLDFIVTATLEGESPTLSGDERSAITGAAVRVANGRVPVVAGVGGNHTAKSVFWARDAEGAGASAILATYPSYNVPAEDGLGRHLTAICEATNLPLVLGNWPARTGADLEIDVLARLADFPRVAGVVEWSPSLAKIFALSARFGRQAMLYSGEDAAAGAAAILGLAGLFSAAANVIPGLMSALLKAGRSGDTSLARELTRRAAPLLEIIGAESGPAGLKAALAIRGRCGETLRLPLAPVRGGQRARIERALRRIDEAGPVPV